MPKQTQSRNGSWHTGTSGRWESDTKSFSLCPWEGPFEDGWYRMVSLRHSAGRTEPWPAGQRTSLSLVSCPNSCLSSFCFPGIPFCNQILAYELLLSLCFLGMWAETVPRGALRSSPSGWDFGVELSPCLKAKGLHCWW